MKRNYAFRPAIWTCLVLSIPFVMTILDRHKPVGDGWHWSPGGFVVMGLLVFGAGYLFEVLASKLSTATQRIALGSGIVLAVMAIWSELAVDAVSQSIDFLLR